MRAVVQRVARAAVTAAGGRIGEIERGLLVFLGVGRGDTAAQGAKLAEKIAHLRIFSNPEGKFDLSVSDVSGAILVVSQFTLYGDCTKGRRPDFTSAAEPQEARALYESFVDALRKMGLEVQTGEFGESMQVDLVNDGPVTLILESK